MSRALVPTTKEPFNGPIAFAARALPGGKRTFMEMARMSNHEAVKAVLGEWDGLSEKSKDSMRIETLCERLGVEWCDFLGAVVSAAAKCNLDVSKLVAAANMPRIVAASVKFAAKENGHRDREMLMKQAGLLPTPGGQQINVHAIAAAKAAQNIVVPEGGSRFEDVMLAGMRGVRGTE